MRRVRPPQTPSPTARNTKQRPSAVEDVSLAARAQAVGAGLAPARLRSARIVALEKQTPRTSRGVRSKRSRSFLEDFALQGQLDDRLLLVGRVELDGPVEGALLDLVARLDDDGVGDALLRRNDVGDEARDRDLGLRHLDRAR